MANDKITQFNTLNSNTVASDDLFIIVDVSAGTSPTGETKNITFGSLTSSVLSNIDSTDIPFLLPASGSIYQEILDLSGSINVRINDYVDGLDGKLSNNYSASVQEDFDNLNSDDIYNSSSVSGSNVSDALEFLSSSMVTPEHLTSQLTASYVNNDSTVTGATVKDALNHLITLTTLTSPPAGGLASRQSLVVTADQTKWSLTNDVLPYNSLVYLNGVILSDQDYTLSSSSLELDFTSSLDDELLIINYGTSASGSASYGPHDILVHNGMPDGWGLSEVGDVLVVNSVKNGFEFTPFPSASRLPDNVTIETNGSEEFVIKNVPLTKIQTISSNTVIGNTGSSVNTPSEVSFLENISSPGTNDTLATTKAIIDYVSQSVQSAMNLFQSSVYPVGSIYTNANVDTDPADLLGFGIWESFGQGRVLIGVGQGNDGERTQTFALNDTAGKYKHMLGITEMPSHTHGGVMVYPNNGGSQTEQNQEGRPEDYCSYNRQTQAAGSNEPHNNIQPYVTVHMWKRTS